MLAKIKLVAPGTKLRKALDDIAMASIGALLLFVDDIENFKGIIQGGFKLDAAFASEKLYELAKMDGAIVLTEDLSKILAANVHLIPESSIPSVETGTRHITAERIAKQTGKLVIAVSSRRSSITVYYKNYRYALNNSNFLITGVNQALNTLAKYRQNFDKMICQLDIGEVENRNLRDVVDILDKGIEILKLQDEIDPYVIELGTEGRLAKMELKEIAGDISEILQTFIMDYSKQPCQEAESIEILNNLKELKDPGPLVIARALGYENNNITQLEDTSVTERGYRVLRYVARIPMVVLCNVIKEFKNIIGISMADVNALKSSVEGIGEKRAHAILDSIKSLKKRASSGLE